MIRTDQYDITLPDLSCMFLFEEMDHREGDTQSSGGNRELFTHMTFLSEIYNSKIEPQDTEN